MKTFRFEEELLREGYLFIASSDSKARYILLNKTIAFKLKNCNKIKRSTKNRNEHKKA